MRCLRESLAEDVAKAQGCLEASSPPSCEGVLLSCTHREVGKGLLEVHGEVGTWFWRLMNWKGIWEAHRQIEEGIAGPQSKALDLPSATRSPHISPGDP